MKDLIDVLFKMGSGIFKNIIYFLGMAVVALFVLSNIKEYAWISKAFVLYTFTH